jgi:hypothetical protein
MSFDMVCHWTVGPPFALNGVELGHAALLGAGYYWQRIPSTNRRNSLLLLFSISFLL